MTSEGSWTSEMDNHLSAPPVDAGDVNEVTGSSKAVECELEAVVHVSQGSIMLTEPHVVKKVKLSYLFCSKFLSSFIKSWLFSGSALNIQIHFMQSSIAISTPTPPPPPRGSFLELSPCRCLQLFAYATAWFVS